MGALAFLSASLNGSSLDIVLSSTSNDSECSINLSICILHGKDELFGGENVLGLR